MAGLHIRQTAGLIAMISSAVQMQFAVVANLDPAASSMPSPRSPGWRLSCW
jgi:hypothetical protein